MIDSDLTMSLSQDAYLEAAGTYDVLTGETHAAQRTALGRMLGSVRPEVGPVLEIGAGTGAATVTILGELPDAHVWAVEPSRAMRAALLSRVVSRPQWSERVTVRPEPLEHARLPERLSAVVALDVLGHFDAAGRKDLFDRVASRTMAGAPMLFDTARPAEARPVPLERVARAQVGHLTYECWTQALSLGGDALLWSVRYRTLDAEDVIDDVAATHILHHPPVARILDEVTEAGFDLAHLGEGYWLARRVGH